METTAKQLAMQSLITSVRTDKARAAQTTNSKARAMQGFVQLSSAYLQTNILYMIREIK